VVAHAISFHLLFHTKSSYQLGLHLICYEEARPRFDPRARLTDSSELAPSRPASQGELVTVISSPWASPRVSGKFQQNMKLN
jgi:hypothetical protein